MKKVIMMRGLPGSGKSTYAKQLVAEAPNTYKRINRDDLRAMFDNSHYSKGNEKFVKQVRDVLIIKALEEGKHVIVDDTNLSGTNETRIRQLVQEFNKMHNDTVQVEIVEMNVSLEECIARDAKRPKPVGAKRIREMHRQFCASKTVVEQDTSLPKAIICDLDGTLALLNGRNPFDAAKCEDDLLNVPVANVLKTFQALGHKILLLSGRKDEHKTQTINWLAKNSITYDMLEMRQTTDNRMDAVVKKELFEAHILGKYYVEFVLDDRNQVVDLWRNDLGLTCFQVNYGDF
ncbi:MAG: AAA family ATPase [Saprospiraceae bacterium]|nr:AAA family ATPase [Saprospiraceae bacterium]